MNIPEEQMPSWPAVEYKNKFIRLKKLYNEKRKLEEQLDKINTEIIDQEYFLRYEVLLNIDIEKYYENKLKNKVTNKLKSFINKILNTIKVYKYNKENYNSLSSNRSL